MAWLAIAAACAAAIAILAVRMDRYVGGKGMSGGGLIDFLSRIFLAPAGTPTPPEPPAPAPPARDPVADFAEDPRIPPRCRESVKTLVASIEVLLPRLAGRPAGDPDVVELRLMRGADLAELLQRYVDIPEEHRAEIFRRTQKSASFHLGASLETMSDRVSEISRRSAQADLDNFTDSTTFVGSRYGRTDDPFSTR